LSRTPRPGSCVKTSRFFKKFLEPVGGSERLAQSALTVYTKDPIFLIRCEKKGAFPPTPMTRPIRSGLETLPPKFGGYTKEEGG